MMDYTLLQLRTEFGKCAFFHAGPTTWNALLKLLKSYYFIIVLVLVRN